MTLPIDSLFAGYRIDGVLGVGGMGAVYLARDPRLPRSVALKVLDRANDAELRMRFEREAELIARLDHPNVIEVYDRGTTNGRPWIAMRHIAGTDVARLIAQSPAGLPVPRALAILDQAAAGLDAAHRKGLVHRDVKPANLLVGEDNGADHVVVTDFGIAWSAEVTPLTESGTLVATLAYVAPEQIMPDPVDRRADVYALGCTLYEMLTGSVPFERSSVADIILAHLNDTPPPPTSRIGCLPPAIDAVITIALAKRPELRYDSCGALAIAARQALTPVPRVSSTVEGIAPQRHHRKRWAAVTAIAVLVSALVAIVAVRPWRPPATAVAPVSSPTWPISTVTTAATTTTANGRGPVVTAWGRDNDLVALLPQLLPVSPDAAGYGGARCTDVNQLNNGHAPAVECTQDSGITWTVWTFRPGDPRRDSMYATAQHDSTIRDQSWTRASSHGKLRDGTDPGSGQGWLTICFDDPARAWLVIDVEAAGRTGQNLVDEWWAAAPV
ncbi:serine/threonine protein kinase [Nocardia sp. NEAU-G5]|uniref:non-specific serine/threonine protein kinase n=1 Tax=Nocardia albiluteola TaxID=2842303 RepID=A0ABS6B4I8_9NOCA|nr:serine/threonine-protein kinase [Nocardia albiluteola]MBU3064346.1 serine/threonine protein kinase [Nocardia albiluteola]